MLWVGWCLIVFDLLVSLLVFDVVLLFTGCDICRVDVLLVFDFEAPDCEFGL